MARAALSVIAARGELSAVRVRVAIAALSKGNRLFEVGAHMAFHAVHVRVLAKQREFRLRMVELLALRQVLPAAGRVARLARLRECSVVRIAVAVGTFRERNARESRRSARHSRRVTFRASHLDVQSGQRIPGFTVVKIIRGLPVYEIVALRAVRAQLSLVRILVAARAFLRKP